MDDRKGAPTPDEPARGEQALNLFPSEKNPRDFDRTNAAALARVTGGLSPAALCLAFADWAVHLSVAPGKQTALALKAWRKSARLSGDTLPSVLDTNAPPCIEPLPGDERFRDRGWNGLPYRLWYENFLLAQQWWHVATLGVPGVSSHHEDVVSFAARQRLDMFSPSNSPFTNPVVAQETLKTGGRNLTEGFHNWSEDAQRTKKGLPPLGSDAFKPARQLPRRRAGVFPQPPVELIQYAPVKEAVHADRAGLGHEVLHPRPVAAETSDPLS